jgi:hypothetical protein
MLLLKAGERTSDEETRNRVPDKEAGDNCIACFFIIKANDFFGA